MSKKFLAIAIIASMLLSAFFGIVHADTGAETIDALNEALANGGTVTLANDIEGEAIVPAGVTVVLDLAGHELKSNAGDTISNHGTLTIKGNGKVTTTANSKGAIVNYSDGNVTIENGTIYAESWYSIKNMGTMKITDANVSKGTNGASVIANGWYGNSTIDRNTTGVADTAILTIDGGTFTGSGQSSTIVKNDDYGILVVNGGELTSSSEVTEINAGPVILNWHDATINGGTFTSTNGSVLANGYLADDADKGSMTVKGGSFISGTNSSILAFGTGATQGKGELNIEGGNFAGKINGATPYTTVVKGGNFSEPVEESKLDESLKVMLKSNSNVDYPYSYYETKEAALEVAEVGDEIDGEVVEATKYTITLNYNHDDLENGKIEAEENTEVELTEPTREGYTFEGWKKDEETIYKAGDKIVLTGDITLIAQWKEIVKEYTLIFKDGYTENDEGQKIMVKVGDDIIAPTLTREGYTFLAWDKEVPSKFEVKLNEDQSEIEEYVFTATWKKNSSSGGGSSSGNNNGNNNTEPDEPVATEWENPYKDIKSDKWHFEYIKKATQSGLFKGMTATEFMPEENLTRGMMITVLYRLSGATEEESATFDDVAKDAYYSKAIAWAAKNKIIFGIGNNMFAPDEDITREDFAAIVYRYAVLKNKGYKEDDEIQELKYEDKNNINEYAVKSISWCTENKIFEGKSNNKIDSKSSATRAEGAKVFVVFSELLSE